MTKRFLKFIEVVLEFENGTGNGYVNDPDDNGGETVSGVTRKNHQALKIWASLDKLSGVAKKKSYKPTKEEWKEIYQLYYENYYNPLRIEDIVDEQLAIQVFDLGVNAGVNRSAKILQEVVRVKQDGIVGKNTLEAVNSDKQATESFRERRLKYYNSLAESNSTYQKFLKGWINRANECKV